MKNEFRELCKKMKDADFATRLLNALKNRKRLQVLETISKTQSTISRLQQVLKKLDHYHSRETTVEEYIRPLIDVGLAAHDGARYYATILGQKLSDLTRHYPDFVDVLPPHSEGYEEKTLAALLKETMTHESLERLIPARNVPRVLSRLQSSGLITTTKENDHVFFFKTRRNPDKESFSPTERRVYESITEEGVPARRLAQTNGITLRRAYKCLRRLKGKKMIFTRERPKSYVLTEKGIQEAAVLQRIQDLTRETFEASAQILNDGKINKDITATYQAKVEMKQKTAVTD
jgi:predicted transcriptional regulator